MKLAKRSGEFVRFCIVGTVGFIVDAGTLQALVSFGSMNPYAGRLLSYLIAASTTWFLNRRYTFRIAADRRIHREWTRYVILNAVGGTANYGAFALCVSASDLIRHYPAFGVAVGSVVGLLINYYASRCLVFRAI